MSSLTVITPAESHDLTALETVKTELGLADSISEDEKILNWIHQASGAIEDYCGRVFAQETVSESWRLPYAPGEIVALKRIPVTEIISVTEVDTLLTADTQYEFDSRTGFMWRLSNDARTCWTTGRLVVVYTAGYELLDQLPYAIERACISLVKFYRAKSHQDPLLRSEEIPGVMRYDYQINTIGSDGGLPPDVLSLLEPYRTLMA